MNESTPDQLTAALKVAIGIIESYQMDIRNSEWTGVDLEAKGFCQGTVYRLALYDIYKAAGWTMPPWVELPEESTKGSP